MTNALNVSNRRKARRRTALAVIGLFAIISVFAVKLVDIQVVNAAEYNADSLNKRSIATKTYGLRGDIVDTNGVVLADSVERYNITVSPIIALAKPTFKRTVSKKTATKPAVKEEVTFDQALAEIAGATGEKVSSLRAAITKDPKSDFAYLAKSATLDVLRAVRALNIPWVYDERQPSRTYPNGAVAGNLVGFIGTEGPQEGLEVSENECLASTDGSSTYERGADGVRLPGSTVTTKQAQDGGTLRLTIDRDFQYFVQDAITERAKEVGADWATGIVVRVKDGHIMAVADSPSVDPNNVNGVGTGSLGSLAFTTPYEPGSTFKPMTAAMLFDEGKATAATEVVVPGRLPVGGTTIGDVWAHGDIRFTTAGILVNSSNVGISILSDRLTKKDRYSYLKKFGIGQKTDVGFLYESAGNLKKPADWDPITNYAITYGQGVTATSAQVASIYQTLGNDGVKMPLTLVEGCEQTDGTVTGVTKAKGERVVSKKAAKTTVAIMENVVTQGGLADSVPIEGYRIAAKTGTAQVAENGRYGTERIVSVAGLFPAEDPEYAVVVTMGKPDIMKTSAAAAPAFRKILTQIIKEFRVTPSTEKAAEIPLNW